MTPEPPEGYRLLTDKEIEDGMTQEGDKLAVICGTDCEWIPVQGDKVMWPRMIYARKSDDLAQLRAELEKAHIRESHAVESYEESELSAIKLRAELARIRAEVEAAPHERACRLKLDRNEKGEIYEVTQCNCWKSRIL